MPIVVKHDPSAAAIGETAYTIGKGTRAERLRNRAIDDYFRAQTLNLQSSLANRRLDIEESIRGETVRQRDEQLAESGRRFDIETAIGEQRYENEPARQLKLGMIHQKLLEQNLKWGYDETQKRELEKITSAIGWVRQQVAEKKWTPQQAEEAETQLWQKFHSIVPLQKYDDTPSANDIFARNRIMNEDGTYSGKYVDAKGNIKIDPMYAQASKENMAKLEALTRRQEKMVEMYLSERKRIQQEDYDETPEQTRDRVLEAFRVFEEVPAGKTGEAIQPELYDAKGNLISGTKGGTNLAPIELQGIWSQMTSDEQSRALYLISRGVNPIEIYSQLIKKGLKPLDKSKGLVRR